MSLSSALAGINPWAVLAAGIVHMLVGLIWYQPGVFGTAWAGLTGKDLKPAGQWIVAGILGHLLIAVVLAILVNLANATTAGGGLMVAVLAWAGFIVTLETGELIWEKIPIKLFMIRVGEHLLSLGLAGIILALWR